MKIAVIGLVIWSIGFALPALGQARANPMLGVQMLERQVKIKQRVFLPNFVLSQWKSRSTAISDHWRFGIDLAYSRTIRPGGVGEAVLSNQFYVSTPVYFSYYFGTHFFIESGIFGGLVIKSSDRRPMIWGRFTVPSYIAIDGDAGLLASTGWKLGEWSKIRIRYYHGLVAVAPWPAEVPQHNRRIEIGIILDLFQG